METAYAPFQTALFYISLNTTLCSPEQPLRLDRMSSTLSLIHSAGASGQGQLYVKAGWRNRRGILEEPAHTGTKPLALKRLRRDVIAGPLRGTCVAEATAACVAEIAGVHLGI